MSRLERLWVLLDQGSTTTVRRAAAEQIGEVLSAQPGDLENILRTLCKYLRSKSWHTRIAAGQAVEAIARNVKTWNPDFDRDYIAKHKYFDSQMTFEELNVEELLSHGKHLLASAGYEYAAYSVGGTKLTAEEQTAFYRRQLNERLGIASAGKIFSTGMEKLIEDSDLVPEPQPQLVPQGFGGPSSAVHSGQGESSRLAGSLARDTAGEPPAKKMKDTEVSGEDSGLSDDLIVVEENMWPFAGFCYQMLQDLDHPQWEYRHGAATAVRGVVKFHGRTAGVTAGTRPTDREEANVTWLEDAAVRLVTVLALDRFADFIGDEVVAPVRATCSQALGVVLGLLPLARVKVAAMLLMHLAVRKEWEVRYSSLLAIQHLLAARASDAVEVLPLLIPAIVARLEDPEDDVKGTAAAALLPVAQCMTEIVPVETVSVVQLLWKALVHLDDLSAATGSIMELLARLLAVSQQGSDDELVSLLPRLFPFMSHGIASVRESCLKAFLTLLKDSADTGVATSVLPRQQVYHCSEEQTISGTRKQALQSHITTVLCLLFHRVAFESHEPLRNLLFNVWTVVVQSSPLEDLVNAVCAWLVHWLDVASYPAGMAADNCVLVQQLLNSSLLCKSKDDLPKEKAVSGLYILGGVEGGTHVMDKDVASITSRIDCMRCLGFLFATVCHPGADGGVVQPLVTLAGQLSGQMVASKIAMQRIVVGLFLSFWATFGTVAVEVLQDVQQQLELALLQPPFYEEVIPLLASMQRDCQSLVMLLSSKGVTMGSGASSGSYTVDFASQVATSVCNSFLSQDKCSKSEAEEIRMKQQNVITGIGQLTEENRRIGNRVSACLAGALVAMQCRLDKLNPVIRPLMEVVKRERNPSMQEIAGFWLTKLLSVCSERKPSPNSKLVRNLCLLAGCSPYGVPSFQENYITVEPTAASRATENPSTVVECTWRVGILSILKVSRKLPGSNGGSHTWSAGGGKGGPVQGDGVGGGDEEVETQFNGVQKALENFARHFGPKLFEILPDLWVEVSSVFKQLEAFTESTDSYPESLQVDMQHCLSRLQVLRTLCRCIHPELKEQLLSLLPALGQLLGNQFTVVRHMAANCLAAMIQVHLGRTLNFLAESVLPVAGSSDVRYRQGVIETLFVLVDSFSSVTVDFAVLFVMPVMGRMSDQDTSVRLAASMCFAQLIPLAALKTKCEDNVPQFFLEKLKKSQDFVEQLLDPRKIESYEVPGWISAELRGYQKDGVNWLAFLSKFNLHGILCDDMGLGKTLQSICVLSGDHAQRKSGPEVSLGSPLEGVLPSIVVCPPTLTGHWCYEVKKFCPSEHLRVLHYAGSIGERVMLQSSLPEHDLVVASYDVVRNDLTFFKSISWNYCILDEGHIIKNPKAKIAKAVKELKSNHRLILTGTPIQNNVVDLWSLFDFLMPGYLGTQRQFQERFGKPILSSRDAKSSSKEQEAGALAMEALHKQVLPFMLRRMKDDVLDDLPPKIIQDYYCELSPLQAKLYETYSKAMMKDQSELQKVETEGPAKAGLSHVFQALQYLKKVCNHPRLVLDKHNKEERHAAVWEEFRGKEESLNDIEHAAKFLSLKQLLIDCGFRSGGGSEEDGASCSAVSQHRALVFCQLKSMLDILENDLLKKHLPEVTYLRLDGSTPAHLRHSLVQRFNTDPSIDLLLLTTHVGGLGLSLTGADTVIFIEHDWNPTKDLQAMDRCHRIGQKKVVNVYRLITRGTLEEKIMNLQKFKLNLANTVVSQENASFAAMDTSSLLDLFSLQTSSSSAAAKVQPSAAGGKVPSASGSLTAVLQELSDIWDEQDYSTEYDLKTYTDSLPSNS